MERDFRNGHLELNFFSTPFTSPIAVLLGSVKLFFGTLPFLAAMTFGVYVPGKLAIHGALYVMDIDPEGKLAYALLEIGDLLLGALIAPAMVYGLIQYCRNGRTASISESLAWGVRQWLRTVGNRISAEVTILLWAALLIVPGIVAMVRLIFIDVVIAIEGDLQPKPLARSRALSQGHGWLILFTMLPVVLASLAGMYVLGRGSQGVAHTRTMYALMDTGLGIPDQWATVPILLMYLGLAQNSVTKLKP